MKISKKLKRFLSITLAFVMLLGTNMNVMQANTKQVNVFFQGNHPAAQVCRVNMEGTDGTYFGSIGEMVTVGNQVGSAFSGVNVKNADVNVTFKGWMLCYPVYKLDNNGNPEIDSNNGMKVVQSWELINDTVYTTAEALAYTVPLDYGYDEMAFMAQWEVGASQPSQNPTNIVTLQLNEGKITLFNSEATEHYSANLEVDKTIAYSLGKNPNFVGTVADPVYWTTNRAFVGWKAYKFETKTDLYGNPSIVRVEVPNTGILTTAELMNYIVPDYQIEFEAQWAGNDEDYYTNVMIDGYGQEITVEEEEWIGPGQTQKVERKYLGIGDYFRQTGDGMRWQMDNLGKVYFKAEPVKEGATLEGWLEYRIIEYSDHSEMKLVSDKLYSTTDMLNRPIPADKTQYVAKWSDIPYDEYPGFEQNAGSEEEKVNIIFSGNMPTAEICFVNLDGTDRGYYPSVGTMFAFGSTISSEISGIKVRNSDEGAIFKGWMLCEPIYKVDSNGDVVLDQYNQPVVDRLVPINNVVYTNSDVLNCTVPSGYDMLVFNAQWEFSNSDGSGSGSGSQNSWGNLFMYAGGGNFDYKFIRDNDEVIEQKGMGLFVYNIDDNKTFKQCMDEKHDGLTAVYKECSTLKGWTLYTCDDVEYLYVPAGQDPAIGDPDLTMLYLFESDGQDCWVLLTNAVKADGLQTTDVIYNLSDGKEYFAMPAWDDAHTPGNTTIENTVDPTASQDGSYEKVDYCKVCNKELSRIKETLKMTTQPVVLTGALAGKTGRVETKSALTEIPETISEKYNTVDAIQDEMIKKTEESNKNFANNKDVKTKLLDVELKVQKEDGTWEVVDPDNFPAEGITFLITYEELGISNPGEYDFVITHMITHGAKAGEVEVLSYTREAAGLRVKTTSLSPIMVSSVGKEETPWYSWFYTTPEGTTAATAGSAVVTSPKTGDNSALMYLMMLAATGVVITFAARKKAR